MRMTLARPRGRNQDASQRQHSPVSNNLSISAITELMRAVMIV